MAAAAGIVGDGVGLDHRTGADHPDSGKGNTRKDSGGKGS